MSGSANAGNQTVKNSEISIPTCSQKFVRSLQTSADTTSLKEPAPASQSQPFNLKLHEESFQTYNCEMPPLEVEVTKDMLLTMYQQMTTMRRMEMAADALYKAKLIRGFCHLAIGQASRQTTS